MNTGTLHSPTSPQPSAFSGLENAPAFRRPADEPPASIINLSRLSLFCAGNDTPSCILAAFGAGSVHAYVLQAECDLERAVEANIHALVRSRRLNLEAAQCSWDDLIFQFSPRSFVYAHSKRVVAYGETSESAERLAHAFAESYRRSAIPSYGSFELIKIQDKDIDTLTVQLAPANSFGEDMLELHYGTDFAVWHQVYCQQLYQRSCGLSILQGAAGTGKTSYLRHLMAALRETHRFYYIQPSHMSVLSKPEFVQFWAEERRHHPDRSFVVILEDADEAIMRRGRENTAHVSAILNLSDGLLGDFIRLQVICTVNCATADIDPALLRPGRLLTHRRFERLDAQAAARLAEQLGKSLRAATDYSLAEIFSEEAPITAGSSRIGFYA